MDVLCLSRRAAWALDGMHGSSVLRRWASIKTTSDVCRAAEAKAGGRRWRPVGLLGVLRGHLMACMARPCYAVGRQQKHASDVYGETEAKEGGRLGRPVGLVGVLHGRSMACMACPCYAVGSLQKHADVVRRGMTSPHLDNTHG